MTGMIALAVNFALAILFCLIVLRRRKRATSSTLAWLLAFFLLPFLGVLLYMLISYRDFERRIRRKPDLSRKLGLLHQSQPTRTEPPRLEPDLRRIADLGQKLTDFPALGGNRVTVLDEAFASYRELSEAMQAARHHIHMEYYIFQPDETGLLFRDLLIAKARAGIECRLLLDHIGSWRVHRDFVAPLKEAGVRFAYFRPVHLVRPWGLHLRNHRKLVVIDGEIGFTGSQNIGNEYLQWNQRGLSWRDAQIKVEGPAVAQLQTIFLEDWDYTTQEHFPHSRYLKTLGGRGDACLQALPTGPDEQDFSLEMILTSLLHAANHRITMLTPYLIPTDPVLIALESAATRGVQIEVLVPHRSDQWFSDRARRAWYRDILGSGVRIFEYDKTFLHAKVVTIDDRAALIGSANMDERSFRLNFECSFLVYDRSTTERLVQGFDEIQRQSSEVLRGPPGAASFLGDVRDGFFRVLSPLL